METDPSLLSFNVALGVLLVDLLLSGDNAIVIALVCRALAPQHRTRALWLGVGGALLGRLLLTGCASLLMRLPLVKLIGGLLLLKISVELIADNVNLSSDSTLADHAAAPDMYAAAKTIVLADIVMSLDNVLALSAVSQNNWLMLVAGLVLSLPILMFGSLYVARVLDAAPLLIWLGGAILGAVSGSLLIDDPLFGGAFTNPSSVAPLVVPVLSALLVVAISRIVAANAVAMQSLAAPPSLWNILWATAPASRREPLVERAPAAPKAAAGVATAPAAAVVEALAPAAIAPELARPATPNRPAAANAGGGEHRILMALGLFILVAGAVTYYLANVYQPAEADNAMRYACKQPEMSVGLVPQSGEIRFATAQGAVKTSITEDRIVWDDYRESAKKLGLAPPVKIIGLDARKLTINGGSFDNADCYSTHP